MEVIESVQVKRPGVHRAPEAGVLVTPAEMERFLTEWQEKGRVKGTLEWYRRGLKQFYNALPEDKRVRRGTLAQWRDELLGAGYAASTVNLFMAVVNTFLEYIGHREYQLPGTLKGEKGKAPELTRNEYLRLLQTAKVLGKEREYLLVKLFAVCDLPVQELEKVTVEAVRAGSVTVGSGGTRQRLHLPACLCRELLGYADRQGIGSGPVFITRSGAPVSRTYVSGSIARLCGEAKVPSEKGNPRCLRRLYTSSRAAIEAGIELLVEQALDRQLEQEQLLYGWES